jgi:RNA polymerase sigma-70 factor (ECF subfamily)
MPRPDSIELARQASAGDEVAFRTLLERYRPRLLERVRLVMGTGARRAAESEDFLHGVLVEALEHYERGGRLRDDRAFLRWLTVIARNKIQDSLRRDRERAVESFSESWLGGRHAGGERDPTDEAELRESVHLLVEALEGMEEHHRRVIELRALEGLSFREVSRRLGRREDATRMLYRRSLARLGRRLGKPPG